MKRGTALIMVAAVALIAFDGSDAGSTSGPVGSVETFISLNTSSHDPDRLVITPASDTGPAASPKPVPDSATTSPATPDPGHSTAPPPPPVSLPKGTGRAYVWADNTGLGYNVAISLVHGATPRQALGLIRSTRSRYFAVGTPVESGSTANNWSGVG
jgi:hypothetical protein